MNLHDLMSILDILSVQEADITAEKDKIFIKGADLEDIEDEDLGTLSELNCYYSVPHRSWMVLL